MDTVNEGTGYLGTFFRGNAGDAHRPVEQRDPKCTLLIRRYKLYRTAKGKLRLRLDSDAVEFPDEAAMVAAIEEGGWFELPAEADGNPRYMPPEFDPKVVGSRRARAERLLATEEVVTLRGAAAQRAEEILERRA